MKAKLGEKRSVGLRFWILLLYKRRLQMLEEDAHPHRPGVDEWNRRHIFSPYNERLQCAPYIGGTTYFSEMPRFNEHVESFRL